MEWTESKLDCIEDPGGSSERVEVRSVQLCDDIPFAVGASPDCWTVYHVPTGLWCYRARSEPQAQFFVELLVNKADPHSWGFTNSHQMQAHHTNTLQKCRASADLLG